MIPAINCKRNGSSYTQDVTGSFLLKRILCFVEGKKLLDIPVRVMVGQLWYVKSMSEIFVICCAQHHNDYHHLLSDDYYIITIIIIIIIIIIIFIIILPYKHFLSNLIFLMYLSIWHFLSHHLLNYYSKASND